MGVGDISNQAVVDDVNKTLGTSFTIYDYNAWVSCSDSEAAKKFGIGVRALLGRFSYWRLVHWYTAVENAKSKASKFRSWINV